MLRSAALTVACLLLRPRPRSAAVGRRDDSCPCSGRGTQKRMASSSRALPNPTVAGSRIGRRKRTSTLKASGRCVRGLPGSGRWSTFRVRSPEGSRAPGAQRMQVDRIAVSRHRRVASAQVPWQSPLECAATTGARTCSSRSRGRVSALAAVQHRAELLPDELALRPGPAIRARTSDRGDGPPGASHGLAARGAPRARLAGVG